MKRTSVILIVVGVIGALVNAWAFRHYPDTWGGPNIGGGFLQLMFYLAVLAGVVTGAVAFSRSRRARGE